jgi:uncharacterized protein YcgI (DUF1989 family)
MVSIEPTAAAYQATAGSFLDLDRALYSKIHEDSRHELVDSFILPIRSGRAWKVPAGYLCRITIPEGPQVRLFNRARRPVQELVPAPARLIDLTNASNSLPAPGTGGRPEFVELQRPP